MLRKSVLYATAGRASYDVALYSPIISRQLAKVQRISNAAKFHSSRLIKAETVKVPQMAESISEGTLKSWSKKVGDSVGVDEEVATIETDKIDVTVNAPTAGKIVELLANEEDTVSVGQDLFKIEPGEGGESSSQSSTESKPEKADKSEPKDQQVDKEPSPPPTPQKSEAQPAQERKDPEKKETSPPPPKPKKDESKKSEAPKAAPPPGSRKETRVKLSRMRLRIAERLKQSQNAAAFLTTFNEIDMSAAMNFRSSYKEKVLKSQGVKIGFMGLFAKAACLTLKEIPVANASMDSDSGEMIYRDYVDLSVAVSTEKGLVTPVVRSCESLDVVGIEREIANLGKKARDGKLGLEDMNGGTFTISNGGVFGSLYGTPIINLPQAAVLGMHTIKERPVVADGQIVIRPIMVVALTYDHRILDGREAVTFLVKMKEYLEDPLRMLLG